MLQVPLPPPVWIPLPLALTVLRSVASLLVIPSLKSVVKIWVNIVSSQTCLEESILKK